MKKSLLQNKPSNNSGFSREKKIKNQLPFTVLRPHLSREISKFFPPVKTGCPSGEPLHSSHTCVPRFLKQGLKEKLSWRTFLANTGCKSSEFALPSHLMPVALCRCRCWPEKWSSLTAPRLSTAQLLGSTSGQKCTRERAKSHSEEWGGNVETALKALWGEQKEERQKVISLQLVEQKPHAWAEGYFLQLWLI